MTSSSTSSGSFNQMLEFMSLVGQLKTVKRKGWLLRNVEGAESVADHMYRMAVLSLCFSGTQCLDTNRCIKLSLVHDLAECIVGDITPVDGISKEEKEKKEQDAMQQICGLLEERIGSHIYDLWQEYEKQDTKESNFVKDLDRFEMVLQAHEYEKRDNKGQFLQEFFDSTKGKFKTQEVDQWYLRLEALRHQNSGSKPMMVKVMFIKRIKMNIIHIKKWL